MILYIFKSFSFIESAQQLSQVSVVSSSGEALVRIIEKDGEFSDLTFFFEQVEATLFQRWSDISWMNLQTDLYIYIYMCI